MKFPPCITFSPNAFLAQLVQCFMYFIRHLHKLHVKDWRGVKYIDASATLPDFERHCNFHPLNLLLVLSNNSFGVLTFRPLCRRLIPKHLLKLSTRGIPNGLLIPAATFLGTLDYRAWTAKKPLSYRAFANMSLSFRNCKKVLITIVIFSNWYFDQFTVDLLTLTRWPVDWGLKGQKCPS